MGIKKIYIFALAAHGQGISGSDRIFIEFARRWSKKSLVNIYVWEEGYEMCQRQGLKVSSIKYQISNINRWEKSGFIVNYLARILEGIRIGLTLEIENPNKSMIYSASEFWMDSIPAFILKIRYPKIKWIAAWFQTAPKPWVGFAEGERINTYKARSFLYWLVQLPIKPMISHSADFVLVNNEEETRQFPKHLQQKRAIVILGAVDLKKIESWKLKFRKLPKIYDAVFQGRFHPQKGVVELIDIWKLVVMQKSDAKLAMIGDGPLMEAAMLKVKKEKLENNIVLTGYLFDGEEKYRIFAQSKVVVHPAFYDSGGMASAEAMAFGLPAVGFDLKSFKSYYSQGMIKVKMGNLRFFSLAILELLKDENKRKKIGQEALNMINRTWSWDKRAQEVLKNI